MSQEIIVDGQIWTTERIASLCEVIWPGKPRWKPTKEQPQQDFYEAVVESLRYPDLDDYKEECDAEVES